MELVVSTVAKAKAQTPEFMDVCACLSMADIITHRASLSAINTDFQYFAK